MKLKSLFSTIAFVLISLISYASTPTDSKRRVELDLSNVRSVEVSRGIDLKISDGWLDEFTVSGTSEVLPYVETRIEGSKLIITIANDINAFKKQNIDVLLPYNGKIDNIKASTGATVESTVRFRCQTLNVEATTGANINIKAKVVDDCYVKSTSGSHISLDVVTKSMLVECDTAGESLLKGEVYRLKGEVHTAGMLYAKDLVADGAEFNVSAAGQVLITVDKSLEAEASLGAVVKYWGDPKSLNVKTTFGGKIDKQ